MRSRATTTLKTKLERNLLTYAAAAGAAGVSSLAQPAVAEVIYTPVKVTITADHNYDLDVNNDGKIDFQIHDHLYSSSGTEFATEFLDARSMGKNQVIAKRYALALRPGQHIGPKKTFVGGSAELAVVSFLSGNYFGYWINVKHRYLGLRFHFKRQTHYGWARLTVQVDRFFELKSVLSGYAYETIPDKPIVAGDEGTGAKSLGHLALGAAGRKH